MTKDELLGIGLTEEQATKVFSFNGKDIEKAKAKLQADVDGLTAKLTEAKSTITAMEAGKGNAEELQKQLDAYKAAERKQQEDMEKARQKADMDARFQAAMGDKEFASDFTRSGVYAEFVKAIADPANKGKGDTELFSGLTKDKDGVFKSKNPPINMGGRKSTGGKAMTKAEIFAIKDQTARQQAIAENLEIFS